MDKEEFLSKRYRLVTGEDYKELREEALNYAVTCSVAQVPSENIRGMLMLISKLDSFKKDYEAVLASRNK